MTSTITKKVIDDLIASDRKGLEEYGVTVDREDYSLRDWLQEAYEEKVTEWWPKLRKKKGKKFLEMIPNYKVSRDRFSLKVWTDMKLQDARMSDWKYYEIDQAVRHIAAGAIQDMCWECGEALPKGKPMKCSRCKAGT